MGAYSNQHSACMRCTDRHFVYISRELRRQIDGYVHRELHIQTDRYACRERAKRDRDTVQNAND